MKAAVHRSYGPPERVVRVDEVAAPPIGADEVLVRVHAAGVNWADASMSKGAPYVMRLGYGIRGPRRAIGGTDVAGIVEAVGRNVESLRAEDAVFGWSTGTFAELVAVPADQLVGKPAAVSFTEAAGMPMAGCVALQALRDVARVGDGSRVLVNGASGGIGTFAVQVGKAMGAEVTGVCSTANVPLVRSLGADRVIDYTREDFTRSAARYDAILDMADNRSVRDRRKVLARDGTLIPNSGVGGPWFGSIGRIFRAWALTPFVSQRLRPFLSITTTADLEVLARMVEDGTLAPVVGSTFPLIEAGAAIALAGSGHARGKTVISVIADDGATR